MAVVQMMCARIGMVTGQGLAGNFRRRFPSWLLRLFVLALLAANTINIAADLAGMADAAEMLSGINSHLFVVLFALLISWAAVQLRYHQIANVLKRLVQTADLAAVEPHARWIPAASVLDLPLCCLPQPNNHPN